MARIGREDEFAKHNHLVTTKGNLKYRPLVEEKEKFSPELPNTELRQKRKSFMEVTINQFAIHSII